MVLESWIPKLPTTFVVSAPSPNITPENVMFPVSCFYHQVLHLIIVLRSYRSYLQSHLINTLAAILVAIIEFAVIFTEVTAFAASCAVSTCALSICFVKILFWAIFVPSTALSAILPVAIVFALL